MTVTSQKCAHCGKVMSNKNMIAGTQPSPRFSYYHKKCKQIVDVMGTRPGVVQSGGSAYRASLSGLWPNMIGERY